MGVIGLTSLIEVNPHLLSDIELRNTNLVIDGNSFCYQLYNISRIDSRFGGDYPKYEALICSKLDEFDSCGIRPIFVFDGLLDVESLKRATAIARQKTRLFTAKSLSSSDSRAKLLPLLAKNALIDILKKRGIVIYQCSGEADAIAVGLANSCAAPVLSQDSDFFIFDLKFGYIPFETLQWRNDHSESAKNDHLSARLYLLDNFLSHYPTVNRRLLPLFAFLCGNDFSVGCNMAKFFDHIHKPRVEIAGSHADASSRKRRSTKGIKPMRRHCNMIAVLEWLGGKNNEENTIEEALKWIEQKRRDKIKRFLQRSMNAYRRSEIGAGNTFDVASDVRDNISHLNLPEWTIIDYIAGDFPAALLQIRQNRTVFLPALIENFSKPTVYECAVRLRVAVYYVLLKTESPEKRIVTEHCRDGGHFSIRRLNIDEMIDAAQLTSLVDLGRVETLSADERQQLFLDCFQLASADLETIAEYPAFMIPFAASFVYWCRSSSTVDRCQACALFYCAFWLCVSRKDITWPVLPSPTDHCLNTQLEFDKAPNLNSKRGHSLEISHLHAFSQWQACFQAVQWLEAIFMRPFGVTAPVHLLFHGRILYNLAVYFKQSKSEDAAFQHLFNGSTVLENSFRKWWALVEKYVPQTSSSLGARGKQKRNRAKKCSTGVSDREEGTVSENNVSDDDAGTDEDWGLENRFRALVTIK